jgi:rhamnose transport system ATP-binding protein
MEDYILELQNIVKHFPGVLVLNDVQFQLKKGEIHALMGENGAGKSTFIKIITGVLQPEAGTIKLNGEFVHFDNPMDATKKSIAAIYQHSTTYPYLSITENMFMGHALTNKLGMLQWKKMDQIANGLLKSLGVNIDPRTLMSELSVAEKQIVEIAKAVSTNAEIIIMDEPTAALSKSECEQLYKITEQLRENGTSVIFISHRVEDIYRLASRVTVLRDGQYVGTWNVKDISKEKLISAMVGRDIVQLFPKKKVNIGEVVLEVDGLCQTGLFHDISFSVRAGEIFGLTGLVGAGRSEVCEAIIGFTKADKGTVKLNGKPANFSHPSQSISAGLGFLPEDRQVQGLILDWEIFRNETLSTLNKYTTPLGMDTKKEIKQGKYLSDKLNVKAKSVMDKVLSLSGGNQQKVVVAKLLDSDSKVLILDEPTKGVDVGAKAQIYEIISDLVAQGYAIILVSSEMVEILAMSDRIGVMCDGRLVKTFVAGHVTQEEVLSTALLSRSNVL